MSNELIGKNIGHATAYAYAKAHGYEGTEEDFAQMLANYDTLVEQASGYAESAGESASKASGYADDASASATAADQAAQRISGITASTTVAGMTDTTKVYVYLGSETGYTSGNWYYYNGSAWVSGGVYQSTALVTDTTLTQSGMAADAKATGDEVADLKEDLSELQDEVYTTTLIRTSISPVNGWRLNESNGLCSSDSDYMLVKYQVAEGQTLKIVSDDRFQFQTSASVPTSGASNRVGDTTYGVGTFVLMVPDGATYLIFSTPTQNSNIAVYELDSTKRFVGLIGGETTNLFNGLYTYFSGMSLNDEKVSNTETDTRTWLNCKIELMNGSTVVNAIDPVRIDTSGRYSFTCTANSNGNGIRITHNGNVKNLVFTLSFDFTSGTTYTISFDVEGYNPSTVGGLVISDIQIEVGDTATAYVPHISATDYEARKQIPNLTKNINELKYATGWERENPTTVADGWRLKADGASENITGYKLIKYAVRAGDSIYLKALKESNTVAQFQNNSSVPSNTNTYIIGEKITSEYDGEITVPNTATYLIISAKSENNTSGIYSGSTDGVKQNAIDINSLAKNDCRILVTEVGAANKVPFHATAGDTISFETVDGSGFSVTRIYFIGKDKTQKAYYGLSSSYAKRTVTLESNIDDIYSVYIEGNANQEVIITNLSSPFNNKDELPNYWKTYLEGRKASVMNTIYSVGNHGVVFSFFTDFHYENSDYHYAGFTNLPHILKYCKENYIVPETIFGGDIGDTYATEDEAIEVLNRYRKDFGSLDVKNVFGNHETNPYTYPGAEPAPIDKETVYSIVYRGMGMEKSVNLQPNMYWYFDNIGQKVRYIAPNTYNTSTEWENDSEQHRWFVNVLENTPNDYTLIIIPHIVFGLSSGNLILSATGENIKTLIDAYANKGQGVWNNVNYDFTTARGIVACIMAGHTHNDGSINSDAGYPLIGTVCDAMWGSSQTVPRGNSTRLTVNEHAFDIVCIDTAAKTIKCVRIGSGEDRIFSYDV